MDNYNQYGTAAVGSLVSDVMKKVYVKMTLGLLVTAIVAYYCSAAPGYIAFCAKNAWFMWVLFGAEVAILFGISGAIQRLSSPLAAGLFYLFAVINGLSLAPIFIVYTHTAITKTFFITAGTFGAMSIYGYTTRQDLSRFGSILIMALIGLVIAMVVNAFLHSARFEWILSIIGVIIFVGLTAWDTQQIKQMAAVWPADQTGRLATIGALNLYLDFLNLFLFLLQFFGGNRD